MKKILVAVDGSDASMKGVKTAYGLAEKLGSELTLVYVVPLVMLPGDAPWVPIDDINTSGLKQGEQALKEAVSAMGPSPVKVSTRAVLGSPAETLVELAHAEGFDLVVVGSTGKGAVKRVLLGSVADRLVHTCERPVLVVR